jgi:hypothetical protein
MQAGLQKLPQLSLVSMAQLLTAAQRAGAGSPLLLRRVVRQALALRPWDNPGHLLYLMGALQRLEQELSHPADVQLWAGEFQVAAVSMLDATVSGSTVPGSAAGMGGMFGFCAHSV